ncbi:MAG: hypothetical protein LAT81_16965 [Oceanicaulis sp.]|nr:hypothetical protein [Oceanicaulis sp.]
MFVGNENKTTGLKGRPSAYTIDIGIKLKHRGKEFWILSGDGWSYNSDHYIYIMDDKKNLIIEQMIENPSEFNYVVKFFKQDGKNDKRKKRVEAELG